MSHVTNCLVKYFNPREREIISWRKFVTHDGYDRYGPESNLYDLVVISRRKKLLFYSVFHREYWFYDDDNEEYYPTRSKIYKNLTSILEKKNYYQLEKVEVLKRLLLRILPDLTVDLILKYLVKDFINENSLTLDKTGITKRTFNIEENSMSKIILYSK